MAKYELWLCTDLGERLRHIDLGIQKLEYTKVVNGSGTIKLTLTGILSPRLLVRDRQLQVWRRPVGGQLALDAVGFLQRWQFRSKNGIRTTILTAPDQNDLLRRRIIAYAAGSSQASTAAAVDDAMKDIFAENFLDSATDTARRWTANDLSVAADLTAGTAIEKAFSWRKVEDVLTEMNEASQVDGTEVFFAVAIDGVDADGRLQLQFKTYTGQPGRDRTVSGGGTQVIFSEEFGNLANSELDYDYRQEENYVYAGGQGEEDNRDVAEVSDAGRIGLSAWGRRELFRDARHIDEGATAELTDAANEALAGARPHVRFIGDLLDNETTRYGRDWDNGDKVTISAFGNQFDAVIRSTHVVVTSEGESIQARAEDPAV